LQRKRVEVPVSGVKAASDVIEGALNGITSNYELPAGGAEVP
jgi:hypothetical protein